MVVLYLTFLRNLHVDFHSGCINWRSHQQCVRVLSQPSSSPAFVVVCFLDSSHFDMSQMEFQCCISFMAKTLGSFFMYLLAIYTSFENYLFDSLVHLLIGLFFWCLGVFLALYILWILILCSMNSWQRFFFSHSVSCFFVLVIVSFDMQELFNSMQFHLSMLAFFFFLSN
jgi:hypothetical protein